MSTAANYEQWIAAHQPTDPRGKCVEMTAKMAAAFPELRRVRGHYHCPLDGRRSHWWLKTAAGQIVDPTVAQFSSNGMGEYEEYNGAEPTGQCLDCGALLFNSEAFCNAECAYATAVYLSRGGRVIVNGHDVTPDDPLSAGAVDPADGIVEGSPRASNRSSSSVGSPRVQG